MDQQENHERADPLLVRVARWAALLLRLALGLFLIAAALLGRGTDPGGPYVAAVGLVAFGAAYLYLHDWRAVMAAVLTSAAMHAEGAAVGLGAGLALGLWLWLAFYLCSGPVKALVGLSTTANN